MPMQNGCYTSRQLAPLCLQLFRCSDKLSNDQTSVRIIIELTMRMARIPRDAKNAPDIV